MSAILAYVDLTLVGYVAVFVATLVFSQKIKDFFKGIPSEARATLNSVEASALGNMKVAQSAVLSQLATALPPVVKPVVQASTPAAPLIPPVAPAAPIAPVPPAA